MFNFVFRRRLRRVFRQGNQSEIQALFDLIYEHHSRAYPEDNRPTRDAHLKEMIDRASAQYMGKLKQEILSEH